MGNKPSGMSPANIIHTGAGMLDEGAPEGSRPKRAFLAHYARNLALTHLCDQAKLLTQTLNILSKILFSQIACLSFTACLRFSFIYQRNVVKSHKLCWVLPLPSYSPLSNLLSPSLHPPFLLFPELPLPPAHGKSMFSRSPNTALEGSFKDIWLAEPNPHKSSDSPLRDVGVQLVRLTLTSGCCHWNATSNFPFSSLPKYLTQVPQVEELRCSTLLLLVFLFSWSQLL